MAEFHEGRLPVNVRMGASYNDEFAVQIVTTSSGKEYRRLIHPFPVRSFNVNFTMMKDDLLQGVLELYSRVYGMYAGFRVKCEDDYSTKNHVDAPTATDWVMPKLSTRVYQLVNGYGSGGTPIGIGLAYRNIYKPVANSTVVAIDSLAVNSTNWTVDTTTGRVTFLANSTWSITNITKAAQAVLTIPGHTLVTGRSIRITGIPSGMTEMNNQRANVTNVAGDLVTVNINSASYTTYSSGGTVNTEPQTGEVITGGCYFDIPCRFNSKIDVTSMSPSVRDCGGIDLIELINP
jgi:uncharacterized protein (TIGR02217 family)